MSIYFQLGLSFRVALHLYMLVFHQWKFTYKWFYRAISAWYDGRDWFYSLCKTVMEQDWSWNRPALDYMELYHAARK